jgi:hypothetical protein
MSHRVHPVLDGISRHRMQIRHEMAAVYFEDLGSLADLFDERLVVQVAHISDAEVDDVF